MRFIGPSMVMLAALLTVAPAGAADNPAVKSAEALVRRQVDALNKGDVAALKADWGNEGSIVDEFPPFYWHGAAPLDGWWSDFQKLGASFKVSDFVVRLRGFKSANVSDAGTYVVASVGITFNEDGKPYAESGDWTFVLSKMDDGWRIVASNWSGAPAKPLT